jgi:hypothetical protein
MAGNPTLPTENIDEVILGLLALEPNEVDELDYETYKSYLKELLVEVTASKRKIGAVEFNFIKDEFKRVRGKKGRFKIKKSKISASGLGLGGIRNQIKGTQKRLMLAPVGGVPKIQEKIETISQKSKESPLLKISETLDSILSTLINIGKQDAKEREKNRRSEEEKRRTGKETELESKTFDGFKKAISTVIKPFQSIWDKIVNFIFYTFLGRVVVKLFDWFGDPKNQDKVKSLIRFVKDWWPVLLGSYILFGTKFGGLIRFVGGWAVRLAFQLGKVVIPKLLTLIAKNPFAALAVAGGIGAYAATQQNKERRDEAAKTDPSIVKPEDIAESGQGPGPLQLQQEQIGQQGLGLGFSGGGWNKGFGNIFSGLIKGPGGPKGDKIPAMLSDGEFVMSAGAVQKYGVDTLEGMNAAGGGTNIPQIASGLTYAAGGGMIGDKPKTPELKKEAESGLVKNKPTFGPGATPRMSSQEDMNKLSNKIRLEQRLQRIENQVQVNLALSKGKGVNIRGATAGAGLGTGYKTIHQGRDAIVIKGGAKNFSTGIGDREITLGGRRYYAQKRGDDVIYVVRDTRNLQSPGMLDPGGMFGGPRNSARMDYAASKGKYYSSSDQKTYGNYNDALAAKKSRMTSLESQQRLNKLSRQGGTGGSSGIRYDTEMEAFQKEQSKRGGIFGGIGRGFTRMFGTGEQIEKIDAQDKASQARVKQAGAASIGRYYSSSDGKYYKDYNAAKLAREQRLKSGVKPLPKATPKPAASGGGSGGGGSQAKPSTKQNAPSPSPRHPKHKGSASSYGIMR